MRQPKYIPYGFELMDPTPEQSTPSFIQAQLKGGKLRDDAVFVPAKDGQPARFECPKCHKPITCWCHVRSVIEGNESPIYYGLIACDCARKEHADVIAQGREQAEKKRTRELTRDSAMTGRYLNARLDNFRAETDLQKQALSTAQAYADTLTADSLTGLYLYGGPATGKTMLACSILNDAIRKGMSAYTITEADFFGAMLDDDRKRAVNSACSTADVLLLDDIGTKRHLNDWNRGQLRELIGRRDAQEKPTLYTSQYGYPDLVRKGWDASTLYRIKANSLFVRLSETDKDNGKIFFG